MIVRLKACYEITRNKKQKFQFYDSPIKSMVTYVDFCAGIGFQFYDSPIKSNIACIPT